MMTYLKRQGRHNDMRSYPDKCKEDGVDWMRGQKAPHGWDERFNINRDNWREAFNLYERDLAIQQDMEYLTEAVLVLYTKQSILTG